MNKAFIEKAQIGIKAAKSEGWLLYDFRKNNTLAHAVLEIPPQQMVTRRFCYWIPVEGSPIKLVHTIEKSILDHLPGEKKLYARWEEFEKAVSSLISGSQHVLMEYSPFNHIPYVSKVDGGMVDLVKRSKVDVISSANLIQQFTSVWSDEKRDSHFAATALIEATVDGAWKLIKDALYEKKEITEFDVQSWILKRFDEKGFIAEEPPICAVNANAANPHYTPTEMECAIIKKNDLILIDLSCRKNNLLSAYGDVTRMAIAGDQSTEEQSSVFGLVRQAQKKATDFIKSRLESKKKIFGYEVDQIAREVIKEGGYGDYFVHRTGHNLDTEIHGPGANLDSYETFDERELLPGTAFTIEPGIYLPGKFGIRLEYDLYIWPNGRLQISGGSQEDFIKIF